MSSLVFPPFCFLPTPRTLKQEKLLPSEAGGMYTRRSQTKRAQKEYACGFVVVGTRTMSGCDVSTTHRANRSLCMPYIINEHQYCALRRLFVSKSFMTGSATFPTPRERDSCQRNTLAFEGKRSLCSRSAAIKHQCRSDRADESRGNANTRTRGPHRPATR